MLQVIKFEDKTKEAALEKCLKELQVTENDLYINESVSEAKLFKAKKIILEVIKKEDVLGLIKDYLKEMSKLMNLEIHSEIKYNEDIINVLLVSDTNSILIGKDGRTLNSIQILIRQLVSNNTGLNIKVNVDASNYKAKKQRNLEYEIKRLAKEVLTSGIEVKLDSMNSYDRRVVHSIISEFADLETESVGESPNRYVVIRKK